MPFHLWATHPVDHETLENLIMSRLQAIGVSVVLGTTTRTLETIGLECAFEKCAFAAFSAAAVVAIANLKSWPLA